MSFVPEDEARTFDTEVIGPWSQLIKRDATSPLFHLPLKLGGLGVGSAIQRHAAAPWRAWQSVLPTLMAATHSSLPRHSSAPNLCNYNTPTFTTDEQACPSPQATGSSPPHQHHPEKASTSTNNSLTATPHHPSAGPFSSRSQHPTLVPPCCSPAAMPTEPKTIVSACPWPGGSCCHAPQPQTARALFCPAPAKAQQVKYVANLWMPNSTTAMGVGTAVAPIAGMPQRPDALLMSSARTAAPRYTSSRPSLPSLVWRTIRSNTHAWILSSIKTVSPRISMSHPLLQQPSPHCSSQHPPRSRGQESREGQI